MLCFMQHLEIHLIETEEDLDLALQSGILNISQADYTECVDCATEVGHAASDGFEPFAVIINEHDQDWPVCTECAAPVLYGALAMMPESYEDLLEDDLPGSTEDLHYF